MFVLINHEKVYLFLARLSLQYYLILDCDLTLEQAKLK